MISANVMDSVELRAVYFADVDGVRTNDRNTLGCFAKRDIIEGELIMTGCAVMNAPCFDKYYPRCSLCWTKARKGSMCEACKMERWCDSCKLDCSSSHERRCMLLKSLRSIFFNRNDDHQLCLAHMITSFLVDYIHHPDYPNESKYMDVMDLCYCDFESLDSLMKKDISEVANVVATVLHEHYPSMHNLDFREYYQMSSDILLRELCNGFSLWDDEYERYAIAIVPNLSYFNHSCIPNAYKSNASDDHFIRIYALQNISQDEEVTFSYVPHNINTAARRDTLRTYFGFDCLCIRCVDPVSLCNTKQILVNEFESKKVHNCGGVFARPPSTSSSSNGFAREAIVCSICKYPLN